MNTVGAHLGSDSGGGGGRASAAIGRCGFAPADAGHCGRVGLAVARYFEQVRRPGDVQQTAMVR
jgi:hypothetical protein